MLRNDLRKILSQEHVSAHMPGHKYKALYSEDWFLFDTTEIEGTDNLHAPIGILKSAMDHAALVYGAKKSFFLVNGSTVGVLAAIMGTTEKGDTILVGRDCHKSVYNAILMHDLNEIVVMPRVGACGELMGYNPQEIIDILVEHPSVKVVVLTSPTYFGFVTQLEPLVELINHRQGILIVDEAHGAHLYFNEGTKGYGALTQGAHIVVQSAHKTLPALTQTAMLHFGHGIGEAYEKSVAQYLEMLQTSSPSYIFMVAIDDAIHYMKENGARNRAFSKEIIQFRQTHLSKWMGPQPQDVYKLWLATSPLGYSGYDLQVYLESKGIIAEFAMPNGVLCYMSVMNSIEDINTIAHALSQFLVDHKGLEPSSNKISTRQLPKPIRQIRHAECIRHFENRQVKQVLLEESVGCICAQRLVPYPPGVPLLLPGELIQQEHIDFLLELERQDRQTVMGYDNTLRSISVWVS